MANEITLTVNMGVAKNSLRYNFAPPTASINLTGDFAAGALQTISTTTTSLAVVSVTAAGLGNFVNLTTGTKIQLGAMQGTNFVPVLRLDAGEPAVSRMATTALVAKVTEPTNGTAVLQWQLFSE